MPSAVLVILIALSLCSLAASLDGPTPEGLMTPWSLDRQKPRGFAAFLDTNYMQPHIDPDWFYDCNLHVINKFCSEVNINASLSTPLSSTNVPFNTNYPVYDTWVWSTQIGLGSRCQIGVYIPSTIESKFFPLTDACKNKILVPIPAAMSALPDNKMNRWSVNLAVNSGQDPYPDAQNKGRRGAIENDWPSWIMQGYVQVGHCIASMHRCLEARQTRCIGCVS